MKTLNVSAEEAPAVTLGWAVGTLKKFHGHRCSPIAETAAVLGGDCGARLSRWWWRLRSSRPGRY